MSIDPQFTNDLFVLAKYLESRDLITLAELHGLITAAASSPKFVSFDQWLPSLGLDEFASIEEAKTVLAIITDMHNRAVEYLESKQYHPLLSYDADVFVSETNAAVAWSEGYMVGIGLCEDEWRLRGGVEVEKLLSPIIVLAADDSELNTQSSEAFKSVYVDLISNAAINIYYFWHVQQGNKTTSISTAYDNYTLH